MTEIRIKNLCPPPVQQLQADDGTIAQLALALKTTLPGMEAQLKMAPPSRDILLRNTHHRKAARKASVLIPVFSYNHELHTLLITRNVYPGVHSGQVAFAGGKREAGDQSNEATALREAREEVGINPADVEVIGCLTDLYIPPSHFIVTPVVGYLRQVPRLTLDASEVAEATFVSLRHLFSTETKQTQVIDTQAGPLETPAYCLDGLLIWGATAMIISELEQIWNGINAPYPFP